MGSSASVAKKSNYAAPESEAESKFVMGEDTSTMSNDLFSKMSKVSIRDFQMSRRMSVSKNGSLFRRFIDQADDLDKFVLDVNNEGSQSRNSFMKSTFSELKRLLQVNTLARELSQKSSSAEQYASIIRTVSDIVKADRAILYLNDGTRGGLKVQVARQKEGKCDYRSILNHVFSIEEGAVGNAAQLLETVNILDSSTDPRFSPVLDELSNYETKCSLAVPIISSSGAEFERQASDYRASSGSTSRSSGTFIRNLLGVIEVINKTEGTFTADDVLVMESVANIVSGFIDRSVLQEKEIKERERKEAILELASSIGSVLNAKTLVQVVTQTVCKSFSAERCDLYIHDADTQVLWTIADDESTPNSQIEESIESIPCSSECIPAHVFRTGETLNIPLVNLDDRFRKHTASLTKSVLCGPIHDRHGKIVGVLEIINKIPPVFMESEALGELNLKRSHSFGNRSTRGSSSPDKRGASVAYFQSDLDVLAFDKDDEELISGLFSMLGMSINVTTMFNNSIVHQKRLECVLENISDIVLTVNTDGLLVSCNRPSDVVNSVFGLEISGGMALQKQLYEWINDVAIIADIKSVLEYSEGVTRSEHTLSTGNTVNYTVKPLMGVTNYYSKCPTLALGSHIASSTAQGKGSGPLDQVIGAVICVDDKTPEQKLKNTLNKYLAPDLVNHLLLDGKLKLGGTKQKVSILFADIRGFTTFSESNGASEVFHTLNEYFSCMVEVITLNGGIVDKFIGDALMAVFGIPNQNPKDSNNAVKAALGMQVALLDFNNARIQAGKKPINIGIGVCTGEVFCGNIGSENRFEYTVIGDSVNIASRLESSTKEYGCVNLVSSSTFDDIVESGYPVRVLNDNDPSPDTSDCIYFREVDLIRVAGKEDTTRVYEAIGFDGTIINAEKQSAMVIFCSGLDSYRNGEIEKALESFRIAADLANDGPSLLFEQRCEYLLNNPPPDTWDGVWDMQKVSVWTFRGDTHNAKNDSIVKHEKATTNRLKSQSIIF